MLLLSKSSQPGVTLVVLGFWSSFLWINWQVPLVCLQTVSWQRIKEGEKQVWTPDNSFKHGFSFYPSQQQVTPRYSRILYYFLYLVFWNETFWGKFSSGLSKNSPEILNVTAGKKHTYAQKHENLSLSIYWFLCDQTSKEIYLCLCVREHYLCVLTFY